MFSKSLCCMLEPCLEPNTHPESELFPHRRASNWSGRK